MTRRGLQRCWTVRTTRVSMRCGLPRVATDRTASQPTFWRRRARQRASKAYLGYSDCGTLLGALYRAGIGQSVHAPMPVDIKREGGEAAIRRVLGWMSGDDGGLDPSLCGTPAAAFNLYTLAMLVGTRFMPTLDGHELHIEEVGEYEYAIDRLLFHVFEHLRGVAGIRPGRGYARARKRPPLRRRPGRNRPALVRKIRHSVPWSLADRAHRFQQHCALRS